MRRFAAAAAALTVLAFGTAAHGARMMLDYGGTSHFYDQADIHLVINGQTIAMGEMPAISLNGTTMVPVREVFEAIGGQVFWLSDTGQTAIYYNGNELLFTVDNPNIQLGKSVVTIPDGDQVPMVINGKTMVPIRAVADLLGFSVEWRADTNTVVLADSDMGVSGGSTVQQTVPQQPTVQPQQQTGTQVGSLIGGTGTRGNMITKVVLSPLGSADMIYLAYGTPMAPQIYRYNSPERVVLDFPGAKLSEDGLNMDFSGGVCVKTVRGANHETMARIVLDVSSQPRVEVGRTETGIVIAVAPAVGQPQTVIDDFNSGLMFDQNAFLYGGQAAGWTGGGTAVSGNTGGGVYIDTSGTVDTTNNYNFDYSTVIIDPGHGGSDPGAEAGGYQEDDINLSIAYKVRDKLSAAGYNVIMTRSSDTHVSLEARVDIASRTTNGGIPALFVSIHCNSFDNPESNGTQVYYHPDSKYGTILAQNIYNQNVANTTLRPFQIHDGSHLYVIRKTLQPAALVETAFISNYSDRAYLVSDSGQEALATGITAGIIQTMDRMRADKGI